ncbi:hypothetical protein IG193_05260 [Infirmifilum lucidum]|uniref:DNA-binding protein n=1 Tax=Infirmifilum lucidum TaxID=2776706 RepID=A0A7L9FEY8_9CREN|nr:hypothetical protein [Infirmifilum lucidum]QOJ78191.1 hypothetical protein IG193_05260 [Infirmifilum lucidum]
MTTSIYRNYSEFSMNVVLTLIEMIRHTKGGMITFNSKKIAVLAGMVTHPVILTLIKDVLERLKEKGYIMEVGRTKHGVKYSVTRESPLWILAKSYEKITIRSLEDLDEVIEKLALKALA